MAAATRSRRSRASRSGRRRRRASAGARADRGLHGDVRARHGAVPARRSSRCGRRPTIAGSAWSPTTRPRPSTSSGSARAAPTTRASSLALGASGWASTATSSARCAGAGRGGAVALCDQDDRWHPEKLAVLREAIGGAGLVYSDQRLVDADGRVLRDTLWHGRRNNHTDLTSMLVANTITGAAMMLRREVAELALPFPDTPGHALPRRLARRRGARRGRRRLRRPAALRLRPAPRSLLRP